MTFKIGSKLVAPAYGIVKICGIETLSVGESTLDFYKLSIVSSGAKLMVPVTSSQHLLRQVMSAQMVVKILKMLEEPIEIMAILWNRRQKIFVDRMNSGSLDDLVLTLKDLWAIKLHQDKLSITEQMLFDKVMVMLRDEMGEAQGLDAQQAESQIILALTKAQQPLQQHFQSSAQAGDHGR